jgi:hypothetical protein
MEETAYEWESIKGMTNTLLVDREIAILQNNIRRINKRLDYLFTCKHLLEKNCTTKKDDPVTK